MQSFKKTSDQVEAVQLLSSKAKHILLYGGSRSGKTAIMIRSIIIRAATVPNSRHLIVRFRFNHVKSSIWYDTFPKIMELCFPNMPAVDNKSDWFKTLPNGSEIWFGGLDSKERTEKILGNEYSTIYFNEISQINYDSVLTAYTRLAQKTSLVNRFYYDCNPPTPKHWSYKLFVQGKNPIDNTEVRRDLYANMLMNPEGNRSNLADDYIETILEQMPERQRKRFLLGQWVDDIEGALWHQNIIDKYREIEAPELRRVVIAVDPATTKKKDSDETGIILGGLGVDNHVYIIEDESGVYSPNGWGMRCIGLYFTHKADRVVAETNQGGDMVENTLRTIDRNVSYKGVHAKRGKFLRAEPVAALYEQGKVHHVGRLPGLETQMTTWEPDSDPNSPDRVDAMVYLVTELLLEESFEECFTV
jgi:phage terminase large subunit-like protein